MLISHQQRAIDFRALAAQARTNAAATSLPQVQELHETSATRWEALAEFEDLFVRNAEARRRVLQPS